jgi:hypothetical protein
MQDRLFDYQLQNNRFSHTDYSRFSIHHKSKAIPVNRPWRPIGLWDVEALTLSRQSAHRWQLSCQPYAPAALYSPGRFLVFISVRGWVDPRIMVRLESLGKLEKKSNDLIGNRTRGLPPCSIVPKPTTLPPCQFIMHIYIYIYMKLILNKLILF